MMKVVGGLALAAITVVVLVAVIFVSPGPNTGALSMVGGPSLVECEVSPPLNADDIGWTPPTDEEWAAMGCVRRP
jgi:hypothetical protein